MHPEQDVLLDGRLADAEDPLVLAGLHLAQLVFGPAPVEAAMAQVAEVTQGWGTPIDPR